MQAFTRKQWNRIIYIARVFVSASKITGPSYKENKIKLAELIILRDSLIDTKRNIVNTTKDILKDAEPFNWNA
jgi:hypothetical protein